MAAGSTRKEVSLLLRMVDEAYEIRTWHGPNLRGSLRGVTAAEASRRPAPGRHNIWEIAVHAAYWKYTVRRRILGEKRGSFPLEGSNWFVRPRSGADWRKELALLGETHRSLRRAIASLDDAGLRRKTDGSRYSIAATIRGVANHDLYHAGQIQLIKRLVRR